MNPQEILRDLEVAYRNIGAAMVQVATQDLHSLGTSGCEDRLANSIGALVKVHEVLRRSRRKTVRRI